MSRPNSFQTAAVAGASADGDTFHVVMMHIPTVPRAMLSDRELFAREELTPEDIEPSCDPFLLGISSAGER